MVARIRTLERRTRQIAAGEFDPMPLPRADDEVRDLARSVNDMAGRLAQLQEAVRRTERFRLVGQLAGGLAHQLRNGVTGARLAVQVHAADCPRAGDEALAVTLRQLSLLESNLRRFIDLGRPAEAKPRPCSLTAILSDVIGLVRPRCRHADVGLDWSPPADPLTLAGDADQLLDLFVNLIENAVEAAGPGGRVEVAAGRGDALVVEVADTGPGPPAEVAARLFEPFATGKPDGIGLGLAVARRAAEAHGGVVTWRRDGGKTVFRVELAGIMDAR